MSAEWFLVAACTEEKLDSSRVLSLHPAVSYSLSTQRVPYKIFNDYCSENRLRMDENEFFKSQLAWFDRFDEFIQQCSPAFAGLAGLGRIHLNRLKYLIDFVIIQRRNLESWILFSLPLFTEKTNPSCNA